MLRFKLKTRAAVMGALAFTSAVLIVIRGLFFTESDYKQTLPHQDQLFRPIDGASHLAVARMLWDKSSLSSNISSPEYQFGEHAGDHKVNSVPDSVRRMFLFERKPSIQVDLSKDYVNKIFTKDRLDVELFSSTIHNLDQGQLIFHINAYRHKIRRKGKTMDVFDASAVTERRGNLKNWETWYLNISQYEIYRHDDTVIDSLLHDLATQPVTFSKQLSGGTQMKLKLTFADDLEAIWKPMRFSRETETQLNHYYFSDFERHHAEIAGFHLDRVLGFRRSPPVSGRILNITQDIEQYATPRFLRTIFYSPVGNKCFYGKCSYYCDSNHAICGHPDWLEGSAAAFLPPDDIAEREHRRNPWRRSYSRREMAEWEEDPEYCQFVRGTAPFDSGRSLLDLIDTHIFDFLQVNMDRHHYEIFFFPDDWKNDTTPVVLDNGRGFGKIYRDEPSILAPLYQCCQVRHSTLQKLLLFDEGPYRLSRLMDFSTSKDPLYPILTEGHLLALDRRVKITLKEIQNCVARSEWSKVVLDDGF